MYLLFIQRSFTYVLSQLDIVKLTELGQFRHHKRCHIDLPRTGTKKSHHLFIRRKAVTDVYKVLCQQIVAVGHEVDEYVEEMDAVEHYGVVVFVFLQGGEEVGGVLCPVHGAVYVVADVVAIVPAFYIVLGIDARNTVLVGIARVVGSNKSVLRPVARHGNDTKSEERQYEYHKCCRPVDKAQAYAHGYKQ